MTRSLQPLPQSDITVEGSPRQLNSVSQSRARILTSIGVLTSAGLSIVLRQTVRPSPCASIFYTCISADGVTSAGAILQSVQISSADAPRQSTYASPTLALAPNATGTATQIFCDSVNEHTPFLTPEQSCLPGMTVAAPQHLVTVAPAFAYGVTVTGRKRSPPDTPRWGTSDFHLSYPYILLRRTPRRYIV